jgi:hypothetical protein
MIDALKVLNPLLKRLTVNVPAVRMQLHRRIIDQITNSAVRNGNESSCISETSEEPPLLEEPPLPEELPPPPRRGAMTFCKVSRNLWDWVVNEKRTGAQRLFLSCVCYLSPSKPYSARSLKGVYNFRVRRAP